jgi:hypothetical protein
MISAFCKKGWRTLHVHVGHWLTVYGWFRELARRLLFQPSRHAP